MDRNTQEPRNLNLSAIINQAMDLVNFFNTSGMSQINGLIQGLTALNMTQLYQDMGANLQMWFINSNGMDMGNGTIEEILRFIYLEIIS